MTPCEYVGAVKFVFWILLAAQGVAAPTNWPVPPRPIEPNPVPAPARPGINVPEAPLLPMPASPYVLPLTNALARPKAIPPPSGFPLPTDIMRESLQYRPAPPTPVSIAATQAVAYPQPVTPKPAVLETNRTFYVAPDGTDENDGTKEKPFRTIQKAADVAQPGDTVLVAPGSYEGFATRRGGKPQQPIRFKADGEVLILSNHNTPADHILVRGTDWIVIEGFVCREAGRAGIAILNSSDVVISNNVCGPNEKWGIFTGFAPRIQILHNKAFGSRQQHGIYVSNSNVPDDHPVIRGNECYHNAGSGIQLNGDCQMGGDGIINAALIEGNIVHHNDLKGLSLISIEGSRIQNNVIYHNGRKGSAGGIHLTDEPHCGKPSRYNTVVNNTICEPGIAAIRLSDGASKNIIFNNLLLGRGIANEVPDNEIDAESNLHSDRAADYVVDAEGFDFRLAYNSRASHAGKASFEQQSAPAHDIQGVPRSPQAPSVGAYDIVLTPR